MMKILDDLISFLDLETSVREIRQGVFHTGVLTRNCGLASSLPRDALRQERPLVKEPGTLLQKSALELAHLAHSESILEAAIGMATINSLIPIDLESCVELNARDLIAEKGQGKRIAMVGHFPFIPKLRELAKALWVIEKNPREDDFTEEQAENLIPQADVVGITGTAFTNHTFENLLKFCPPHAYVVVLGDTTPLSPFLFDYGVDAISGTKVVDPELALRCVSEGANFRQIRGVKRLTMVR
ncbi:MAG: DUF364 domain-containing protein [Desulfobacteraceae bacterium]|jgi:hypothetical protein